MHVFQTGDQYALLESNRFESDDSIFNSSPAVADDALLIRSNKFLYCVGN